MCLCWMVRVQLSPIPTSVNNTTDILFDILKLFKMPSVGFIRSVHSFPRSRQPTQPNSERCVQSQSSELGDFLFMILDKRKGPREILMESFSQSFTIF